MTSERTLLEQFLKNKPASPMMADKDESASGCRRTETNTTTTRRSARTTRCALPAAISPLASVIGDPGLSTAPVAGKSAAEAEGDLMAVARLTFSTEPTRKSINLNQAILIATAIITVFLAMVASYVIVRYVIVKPLRHLRDVSDAISRGNTTLRADIHTGDEFEELAVAFNRMLRHLTDAQGELRLVNANLDGKVDELAQANMRLYELNMLKSDFLATMSHELRTPLNSILGFSEVLGSIDSLDEKQKRYVQNIQKSGKTLLEMINDILDLAKIESGKMETRLTRFPHRAGGFGAVRHGPAADGAEEHRPGEPRRRRLAADAPGPGPRAADPQQPAVERDQVHARGRANHRVGPPRRVELHGARSERHGRGHRAGGPTDDLREVPPGQDGHARRRRHDPRIFRQRPGAFDRQGALPAVGRRGFGRKASWARAARSPFACPGCSKISRGSTRR